MTHRTGTIGQRGLVALWTIGLTIASYSSGLRAEQIAIDDDLSSWIIEDFTIGQEWEPGDYSVDGGAVTLATNGIVPLDQTGNSDALCLVWAASRDKPVMDGYLQARIRLNSDATAASIGLRSGLDGTYFYGIGGPSQLVRLTRYPDTEPLAAIPFSSAAGDELYMKAGAVGQDLSLKIWRVGEIEPDQPQMVLTDDALTIGELGLCTSRATDVAGLVNATFSDVHYFPVPEPTGCCAMLSAFVLFVTWNRRRKDERVR